MTQPAPTQTRRRPSQHLLLLESPRSSGPSPHARSRQDLDRVAHPFVQTTRGCGVDASPTMTTPPSPVSTDHPRGCEGDDLLGHASPMLHGPSQRAPRQLGEERRDSADVRAIPADVGSTTPTARSIVTPGATPAGAGAAGPPRAGHRESEDHPRGRRGDRLGAAKVHNNGGSSLRARGRLWSRGIGLGQRRSTPAGTGSTSGRPGTGSRTDHPRECGVDTSEW